jgi:uncharacterized ferritin-like protein (DUF455 family)
MQATAPSHPSTDTPTGLRQQALQALAVSDPTTKVHAAHALAEALASEDLKGSGPQALNPTAVIAPPPNLTLPGRPDHPTLIPPVQVPHRSPFTPEGLAALLHAITHIEFNAINLALDAVWRFPGMPDDYYRDWIRVGAEEATHFGLLREHLQSLGFDYGDFPAHDGLWEMCIKTHDNVTARMALVPRTLEARGLDATPLIQARLRKVNTPAAHRAIEILDVILRDEVGHVAIGNRWYGWLCRQQGLEPLAHYRVLARQHQAPRLKPPFNEVARRAAGFNQQEMNELLGGA